LNIQKLILKKKLTTKSLEIEVVSNLTSVLSELNSEYKVWVKVEFELSLGLTKLYNCIILSNQYKSLRMPLNLFQDLRTTLIIYLIVYPG
jgi:hypothetical protein